VTRAGASVDEGRTLILGATSLVGRFLVPRLVENGVRPLMISRRPLQTEGVDGLQADLREAGLAAHLPKLSTVYSLSPIWLLPDALPALIGTAMKKVIAFSSTSRFTKIASPIQAERDVAARLAESEARTIALCEDAGVRWIILRPTLIYAEGLDGNVSRLAYLIRQWGVLPLAGRGQGLRQPVHADDLARAAIAAMATPGVPNRAYDLPGGETLTYRAMAERIFEGLGRTPRIVSIPAPLWSLAFRLSGPFLPGATAAMGARMSEDLIFDPQPAQRDLGWAPRDFHPDFTPLPLREREGPEHSLGG
jgi:nucleoside-diphosphate-sugar epimerase